MNIQQAIDAPRFHHQWLPDRIRYEALGLSPDTLALLERHGHVLNRLAVDEPQGLAEGILVNSAESLLEGASDHRAPDGAAIGY
jgi:gamma-glutamyltranspeptidase/glutathione hydrolase